MSSYQDWKMKSSHTDAAMEFVTDESSDKAAEATADTNNPVMPGADARTCE